MRLITSEADKGQQFLDSHTLDDSVLSEYTDPKETRKVKPAIDYKDEVHKYLIGSEDVKGDNLPFSKCKDIRFRKHEVTCWTGYNGSYKSMLLGQVCLGFISQGKKVVIASPEMPPKTTLGRMVSQFAGSNDFAVEASEKFYPWVDGKLWLYDQSSGIVARNLIAVIYWCVENLQIDHFVIDSLMKCGINGDDYNKQKWFVDQLCIAAKDMGIHIHLVAHQKKPQSHMHEVNRYDISGTGDISNLVDNVIICYRNFSEDLDKNYTNGIHVDKQRHYAGGTNPEPKYVFWLDDKSLQFTEKEYGNVYTPSNWVVKEEKSFLNAHVDFVNQQETK